jgi:hypothetical protein
VFRSGRRLGQAWSNLVGHFDAAAVAGPAEIRRWWSRLPDDLRQVRRRRTRDDACFFCLGVSSAGIARRARAPRRCAYPKVHLWRCDHGQWVRLYRVASPRVRRATRGTRYG